MSWERDWRSGLSSPRSEAAEHFGGWRHAEDHGLRLGTTLSALAPGNLSHVSACAGIREEVICSDSAPFYHHSRHSYPYLIFIAYLDCHG